MYYIKFFLFVMLAGLLSFLIEKISNKIFDFISIKRRKNSKYCNYCRLKYDKSWKFCGSCGRELGNKLYVKRCLECDYSTDDFNEFFCPHCNEDLRYFEVEEDE